MENSPLHVCQVKQPQATINRAHTLIHGVSVLTLLYFRASVLFQRTGDKHMLAWALVSASELLLFFIWLLRQPFRWRPVSRTAFPEGLPGDGELPAIDVFICTADPKKEPTVEVMNTVISAMSLDYPLEKLSVYLSDDAGSPLTLHAIHEAYSFARAWVPFCRKYRISTGTPEAFFSVSAYDDPCIRSKEFLDELEKMKSRYELFKERVQQAKESYCAVWSQDRPPSFEVVNDKGTDVNGKDQTHMPLLAYVSREKRPSHPHHFKAGALNVLLRVSGIISNAPYILVLDCDMNCNDPTSARQAMCFHLDPKISQSLAYVQFPQMFYTVGKNDIYEAHLRSFFKTKWPGIDGLHGPILSGTGFYIKREALYGNSMQEASDLLQLRHSFGPSNKFIASLHQSYKCNLIGGNTSKELLQEAQLLGSCNYEKGTHWGEQRGFQYHSLVEDYFTGFILHCRGWNSVYCYPSKPSFLGSATITLNDSMVQYLRWMSGLLEVGFSRFCPIIYGLSRMSIPQSMCYGHLAFMPLYSLPLLCYATLPQLCLLNGISLYPKVSNPWFVIFVIVFVSYLSEHLSEVLFSGESLRIWWNEHRFWMIRSVTGHFFGCLKVIMKWVGIKEANFMLTSKVVSEEQVERYKMGIFSFEGNTLLLITLITLVTLNMVSFIGGLSRVINEASYDEMFGQIFLIFFILIISYPIIEGMILRKDSGRVSTSVTLLSVVASIVLLSLGSVVLLY